jgi:hypothetical protein
MPLSELGYPPIGEQGSQDSGYRDVALPRYHAVASAAPRDAVRSEHDALVAGSAVQRRLCRGRIRSPTCVMAGPFQKRRPLLLANP